MIWEEFISEMTEHNTSAKGMNWDWGTGDICTGDRSPVKKNTHTHKHTSILLSETGGPAAVNIHKHTCVWEVSVWLGLPVKTTQSTKVAFLLLTTFQIMTDVVYLCELYEPCLTALEIPSALGQTTEFHCSHRNDHRSNCWADQMSCPPISYGPTRLEGALE